MNFSFASALLRGKWAIDPQFALNSGPLVADILNGNILLPTAGEAEASAVAKTVRPSGDGSGIVGIVNIHGALVKASGPCGEPGMEDMGLAIRALDSDPAVSAIVLHIDSPGGTVDGTQALAAIVKSTRKPVVAFVDGLMASAALWIGSAADEVYASSELDEVGSVGVLMSFADMQPAYEQMGVKFHKVVSSLSPDKVKWFEDLRAGNYDDYIKDHMDPIAQRFQQVLRENRPNVKPEHMTGKVYFARDVMGALVDQIGTLENAAERALELSRIQTPNNIRMNYERINAVLGPDALEFESDGRRTFTAEEMQLIEAALVPQEAAPADSSEEIQGLRSAVAHLEATVLAHQGTISEQEEQIRTLIEGPGATPPAVPKETDGEEADSLEELSTEDLKLFNLIKR